MIRSISYYLFLFLPCLLVVTPLYAATQTLTTYYPAPGGNYNNLTINTLLSLPSGGGCGAQASNGVAMANNGGVLEVCDSSGEVNLVTTGFWLPTAAGNAVYPAKGISENVEIGSTTDFGYKLGVAGTSYLNGATTIGGVLSATSGLSVTGNTSTGTLTTGTITFSNGTSPSISNSVTIGTTGTTANLTVTGATTLTGGATVGPSTGGSNLDINTANVAAPSEIQICNSGTGCHQLEVAEGTDYNYYAVYAP